MKITAEGQRCPKCRTPVIRQSHHKPPVDKYGGCYFEWWFRCPGCHTLYMVEAAKRSLPQPQELPLGTTDDMARPEEIAPWE